MKIFDAFIFIPLLFIAGCKEDNDLILVDSDGDSDKELIMGDWELLSNLDVVMRIEDNNIVTI